MHAKKSYVFLAALLAVMALLLSGCGLFGGGGEAEATPTLPPRTVVPTFTPTPVTQPPAAESTTAPSVQSAQVITLAAAVPAGPVTVAGGTTTTTAPASSPVSGTAVVTAPAAAATAVPAASLVVADDQVNVRLGPGTEFGLVGAVDKGMRFDIKGRNQDKTWWLVCCVNGKEGWVFGQLATVTNGDAVAVAQNIPTPPTQPVAQAQPQQPAPPAQQPTPTPAPAPPPAADPCAGIGGDGCKWHVRGGPKFAPNGGTELKFQLHFIHSGIDGGQPQASYFIWVEKDGQKLPVGDQVRSILQDQQGTQGKYNYEYKLGMDSLPGNNVAGSYTLWVLDGNGERDSENVTFTVPDGQGEVWIEFDQAPR